MLDADLEALGLEAPGEGKRILEEKFGNWHGWENAVTRALQQAERAIE